MGGYRKCPVCLKMFLRSQMYRVIDLRHPNNHDYYCFGCSCDAAHVGDYVVPSIVDVIAQQKKTRLRQLNYERSQRRNYKPPQLSF